MFIKRKYDLKGSSYQRESLKNNELPNFQLVLKDSDFLKLEKKILLDEE